MTTPEPAASLSLMSLKRELSPELFARALRARGAAFRDPDEGIVVVTDYGLAEKVLKHPDFSANRAPFFAARMGHLSPEDGAEFFDVAGRMMVASDPPVHTARRKLGASGITDEVLDAFRPAVERAATRLVAEVASDSARAFDFVSRVAQELPSTVLADLFGVAHEDRLDFYAWANEMTQFFGAGRGCPRSQAQEASRAAVSLRSFFLAQIKERRETPRNDFVGRMLVQQRSLGLDDNDVVSQAIMMLVAGKVTTTDQMSNCLHGILSAPGVIDRLRATPERLPAATEEATRLDPSVNFVFRTVQRDGATLGDLTLAQGEVVFVSLHAANRDPAVFRDPDVFSLERSRNPHLSFGGGAHFCLGARLGRIQLVTVFSRLLERCPDLRLDPERAAVRKHESLGFSGFETLPVVF